MKRRITQSSIAREAGVSCAAVSMVLSGNPKSTIAPETRERILRVAETLGYSTPPASRHVALRTIGYLHNYSPTINFSAGELPYEVTHYLEEMGYDMLMATRSPQQPITLPDWIVQRRVQGVIIQGWVFDPEWVREILRYVPAVSLNHDVVHCLPGLDSVAPDNASGMRMGLQHLAALGHRRIAFFSKGEHPQFRERLLGYRAAMSEMALPIPPDYIASDDGGLPNADADEAFALSTLHRWMALPEPPTAVLAVNDDYALLLMATAQSLGIAVPTQLSVIGFDNTASCGMSTPSLTSIQRPITAMGRMAVQLLLDRINGIGRPQTRVRMDVELIPRASTVAPCATPVALLV
ncbi:MAG TPA: LacI family DNA-binding transcriptional regulator [Armatimonadota bacterium]|jgi:DNA-binding LacI/PurR family transcriptional regulator